MLFLKLALKLLNYKNRQQNLCLQNCNEKCFVQALCCWELNDKRTYSVESDTIQAAHRWLTSDFFTFSDVQHFVMENCPMPLP